MIGIIVSGGISFLVVLFSTLIGVNFFKSRNIGQQIQKEVDFHDHKRGTPTMGGLFIVFGTFAGYGNVDEAIVFEKLKSMVKAVKSF